MKKLLTPRHKLGLPVLLVFGMWSGVQAQSLGTPSVTAWIGRPLEMTVPARFAAAGSGNECVHADVFFGDTRLPSGRVRATILGSDPQQKQVRIQTDTLIDEPVVTVSVRAGCVAAITRSYTLLPELPSEQVIAGLVAQRPGAAPAATALSPAMAAAASMAPLPPAAAAGTTASTSPRDRPGRTPLAAAREATRAGVREPTPAKAREPAPPSTRTALARSPRPAVAATRSAPRLRLEPIETDGMTLLRASTQLAEPAGDAARRATAALLWQAINADPQEVLRTTVMLQGLERDLAQLRENAGQTRAEMAALRQRLDAAQPWYSSGAAVQVLGLLLLLATAAAGLFWYRTRHGPVEHWYAPAPAPDLSAEPAAADDPTAARSPLEAKPAIAEPLQPVPVVAAVTPARPDLPAAYAAAAGRERAASASPVPQPAPRGPINFDVPVLLRAAAPSQRRDTDGVLRVETLAATFEEVEFLLSLGLAVNAAGVLKSYLQDSGSPAPIAFFELIRLCEHEGDSAAAALVRRRYAQVFGAEAPPLELVTAPLGLDSLAGLGASITSTWNTPGVLRTIEDALFAAPTAGPLLTLQAGRDLLCLHDVAMRLIAQASSTPAAGDGHALAPWAHAEDAAGAHAAVHATDAGDGVLGVDIDLGATPAAGARRPVVSVPSLDRELAQAASLVSPLVAEMRAAAREAEERSVRARRQAEEQDAFSAATASERIRMVRH